LKNISTHISNLAKQSIFDSEANSSFFFASFPRIAWSHF